MLDSIIGNRSLEKILLFLLLNDKCYAAQLSQCLSAPMTPLQYALCKLEKSGVLVSHIQGKTRYFEFNHQYPLLHELEALLKKAFFQLPEKQQKFYYSPYFAIKPTRRIKPLQAQHNQQKVLQEVWHKLAHVRSLSFLAKSKSVQAYSGWNGLGKGDVQVTCNGEHQIIYREEGVWRADEERQFAFTNAFRWTSLPNEGCITLEHLRFGVNRPVFLFSLAPVCADKLVLESTTPHNCKEDAYFGQLRCEREYVQFNWRVLGPKKNENIDYLYS